MLGLDVVEAKHGGVEALDEGGHAEEDTAVLAFWLAYHW